MTVAVYPPLRAQDVLGAMAAEDISASVGLVLFDVDLTLGNGCLASQPEFEVREGAVDTVCALLARGFQVGFWSGGGAEHAHDVAVALTVRSRLAGCWRKPSFPMTVESVRALAGAVPVLTVDDDPAEALPGVPFLLVRPFWGALASAEDVAAYEQGRLTSSTH